MSTVFVQGQYASKAQLVQVVQVDQAASDLFGDTEPTPIGSAQMMIISDESVFLPNASADGARLADDAKLKAAGVYPLQLKTVEFTVGIVRLGLIGGGVVFALIAAVVSRRTKQPVAA